jgi:hypothetical protein
MKTERRVEVQCDMNDLSLLMASLIAEYILKGEESENENKKERLQA